MILLISGTQSRQIHKDGEQNGWMEEMEGEYRLPGAGEKQ